VTSCKDCIHVDICEFYSKTINHGLRKYCESEIPFDKDRVHSEPCELFKDHSRFVELPCRVSGDCFFVNQNGTIQRATLERVYMFSTSTELFLNDGREIYSTSLNESNIELFPTYEEAEQALKEKQEDIK
jgi:hypothetical protein